MKKHSNKKNGRGRKLIKMKRRRKKRKRRWRKTRREGTRRSTARKGSEEDGGEWQREKGNEETHQEEGEGKRGQKSSNLFLTCCSYSRPAPVTLLVPMLWFFDGRNSLCWWNNNDFIKVKTVSLQDEKVWYS